MSVFRAKQLTSKKLIRLLEADHLDHWLWGDFRFLSGDDKSTWYCMLLQDSDGSSSTNNGIIRRVEASTVAGALTVAGAALGAEDEAIDFILMRFNPDQVKAVFNRVRTNVYPAIGIIRDHQPLVTGQVQRRFLLPSTLRNKPLRCSWENGPMPRPSRRTR